MFAVFAKRRFSFFRYHHDETQRTLKRARKRRPRAMTSDEAMPAATAWQFGRSDDARAARR